MITVEDVIEQTGRTMVRPEWVRILDDQTYIMAVPLLFHWMLIRGHLDWMHEYFDRWCYANQELAIKALRAFPQSPDDKYEPEGWHRHPATARRRPDGNPALEYIDP